MAKTFARFAWRPRTPLAKAVLTGMGITTSRADITADLRADHDHQAAVLVRQPLCQRDQLVDLARDLGQLLRGGDAVGHATRLRRGGAGVNSGRKSRL